MKLFVANIDYSATEEDIRKAFELAGYPPFKVKLIYDRITGESRGFGFVEMANADEAQDAIAAVDGIIVHGRKLSVRVAKPENRPAPRARAHAHG
jgi:cold-inducible RNA-binding protein